MSLGDPTRGDDPAERRSAGPQGDGSFVLLNAGKFRDKAAALKFLQKNPGYVWKHRGWLKSQLTERSLREAGYILQDRGRKMSQWDRRTPLGPRGGGTQPKMLRSWSYDPKDRSAAEKSGAKFYSVKTGTVKPPPGASDKIKPPPGVAPPGKIKPPPGAPPPGGSAPPPAVTGAAGGSGNPVLDLAMQRLLGLNPNAGQTMIDPVQLLAGVVGDTQTQTRTIRNAMKQMEEQGKWNTASIDKWYRQVGDHVARSQARGQQMTADLGAALGGNSAAILESIGGSAAPGASPVGQTMQQGQNTLAALGAADAQFLNDMGPLLQAEGAGLKARELGRLAQVRREYQDQLSQVSTAGNSKRAELALQIAQANNAVGQQKFNNQASLAETIAGLAMSTQKLSADQTEMLNTLMQRQDQMNRSSVKDSENLRLNQIKEVANLLPSPDQLASLGIRPHVDGIASQELVKYIRSTYQQVGLPMNDPRVINSMIGAIRSYGGDVPAEWVRGWRG